MTALEGRIPLSTYKGHNPQPFQVYDGKIGGFKNTVYNKKTKTFDDVPTAYEYRTAKHLRTDPSRPSKRDLAGAGATGTDTPSLIPNITPYISDTSRYAPALSFQGPGCNSSWWRYSAAPLAQAFDDGQAVTVSQTDLLQQAQFQRPQRPKRAPKRSTSSGAMSARVISKSKKPYAPRPSTAATAAARPPVHAPRPPQTARASTRQPEPPAPRAQSSAAVKSYPPRYPNPPGDPHVYSPFFVPHPVRLPGHPAYSQEQTGENGYARSLRIHRRFQSRRGHVRKRQAAGNLDETDFFKHQFSTMMLPSKCWR